MKEDRITYKVIVKVPSRLVEGQYTDGPEVTDFESRIILGLGDQLILEECENVVMVQGRQVNLETNKITLLAVDTGLNKRGGLKVHKS